MAKETKQSGREVHEKSTGQKKRARKQRRKTRRAAADMAKAVTEAAKRMVEVLEEVGKTVQTRETIESELIENTV